MTEDRPTDTGHAHTSNEENPMSDDDEMRERIGEATGVPLLTPGDIRLGVTDAVVQAACDEADWSWRAGSGVPSPQSCMRPVVQAAFDKLADDAEAAAWSS